MKLKTHLRDCTYARLRSIADFWGLALEEPDPPELPENTEPLASHLYPRVQTPGHFKAAFERLETGDRDIVYFLALHGGELPVDEFRRRTGLHDDARFEETLERLGDRGFVWREYVEDEDLRFDLVGVPEPFVRLVDLPPYWRGFLGHYLQTLGLAELKVVARQALGYRFQGRRRQALVHFIRNGLLDPETLRGLLERQSPAERELFQQIFKKNGACVWRDLLDGGAQKKFNHAKAEVLESLTTGSGLVHVWRAGPNKYNNMVMVPRDVAHAIHGGFRRDERTLEELTGGGDRARARLGPGGHPNVVLDNTQNILRDLVILLAYVRRHRVRMLNNGSVGRNDLKKIVARLSHNKTPKYAMFLALFATSRKLMIPVGDQWRTSKNAGAWLRDARRAYFDLYEFWLVTSEWNEEYVDGDVVHVDAYPQNLIGIAELRKLVLRVLEKAPTESWIDFDTFAESLQPQVAIEIPGRFEHAPHERFNRHTALVMESVVAESLYWLGIVTLGVSDLEVARELGCRPNEAIAPFDPAHPMASHLVGSGEHAFCFRPSPIARQLFEGRYLDPPSHSRSEDRSLPYGEESLHVTVQPNLEIVTPPDLSLERFYQILAFTDVKKVDIVTTLSISRESVRMGMEEGFDVKGILETLRASSRRELPETVVTLVEECGARHGEVDVGSAGGYIVAGDPMHVEELRANPRVGRHVKEVFQERLMLLDRTVDLKKVTKELERMGFVPHVASDTIHVTGEGMFHLTVRPEELYRALAVLEFAKSLEEDLGASIFDGHVEPLLERLSRDVGGEFSPSSFVEPLVAGFKKNHERLTSRKKDDENRKLKKQVNRLLTRVPRQKEPDRYDGENPASEHLAVVRLLKYAIEHEAPVKIHYLRSTGEAIDEVIEPESIKGERVYAYCKDHDEHHIYYVKRIEQAAI